MRKIILPDEQLQWVLDNYAKTSNKELGKALGVSESYILSIGRRYGASKDKDFLMDSYRRGAKISQALMRVHGTYPKKGQCPRGCERTWFKKGETSLDRLGPEKDAERAKKSVESRLKTIKRERARVIWGLEQKTKLRLGRQPREKVQFRYNLKKKGYVVDDAKRVVYWNNQTKRSLKMENNGQPWYRFEQMLLENN